MGALQPIHLLILLAIVLVLFGGSRLAGLGKSSGRAIREFKEETKGLRDGDKNAENPRVEGNPTTTSSTTTTTTANGSTISEPERVENPVERRDA